MSTGGHYAATDLRGSSITQESTGGHYVGGCRSADCCCGSCSCGGVIQCGMSHEIDRCIVPVSASPRYAVTTTYGHSHIQCISIVFVAGTSQSLANIFHPLEVQCSNCLTLIVFGAHLLDLGLDIVTYL